MGAVSRQQQVQGMSVAGSPMACTQLDKLPGQGGGGGVGGSQRIVVVGGRQLGLLQASGVLHWLRLVDAPWQECSSGTISAGLVQTAGGREQVQASLHAPCSQKKRHELPGRPCLQCMLCCGRGAGCDRQRKRQQVTWGPSWAGAYPSAACACPPGSQPVAVLGGWPGLGRRLSGGWAGARC